MSKINNILSMLIILTVLVSVVQTVRSALTSEVVTVDFAVDKGTPDYKATGFLHGFDDDGISPPSDVVDPLKIKFSRTSPQSTIGQVDRLRSIGAIQQVVMSDGWGYRSTNLMPGDDGNWEPWETFVVDMVNDFKNRGVKVQYDVWNEPNYSSFWSRSVDQYNEMWRRAYIKIRETDPSADIAGPSHSETSPPKTPRFTQFLDYCKANNCLPDILTWHFPTNLESEISFVNDYLSENSMTVKQMQVTEYGLQHEQYSGRTAKYLGEIQRSSLSNACRSVWFENWQPGGRLADLDNIIFKQNDQWHRRGEWWVYKSYADITGTLVNTIPTTKIELVAGKDSSINEARVLLGTSATTAGKVTVHFDNISDASFLMEGDQVRVVVERIPGTYNAVESLPVVMNENFTVTNNQLDVDIDWANKLDAYNIILTSNISAPTTTSTPVPTSTIQPTNTDQPGVFLNFGQSRLGDKINQYTYSDGTPGDYIKNWGSGASIYNDNGASDAYVMYKFEGTKVKLYGEIARYCGIAAVSILDSDYNVEFSEEDVDFFSHDTYNNALVYTSPELLPGVYTIKVRITGDRNELNTTQYWTINLSNIEVIGAPTPTPKPTNTPTATPTSTPTPTRIPLSDVDSHWAKDYINSLYLSNIINGYPDGTFKPNNNVTRAEMAVILVNALGVEPIENPENNFIDSQSIPPWAAGNVAKLVEMNIIRGYPDGTFMPSNKITRSEIAVMIIKSQNLDITEQGETNFADNSTIPEWAMGYVSKAAELNIIKGSLIDGSYYFKPLDNATRAEVCVMIDKMSK